MNAPLNGSDYGQLRAFVMVGEALSFSRAAEALGVSPSALSQLVRGLEDRVGARLFNRTTRSVALTEAGEALFQRVRPAVAELGAAVGQARRRRPATCSTTTASAGDGRAWPPPMPGSSGRRTAAGSRWG